MLYRYLCLPPLLSCRFRRTRLLCRGKSHRLYRNRSLPNCHPLTRRLLRYSARQLHRPCLLLRQPLCTVRRGAAAHILSAAQPPPYSAAHRSGNPQSNLRWEYRRQALSVFLKNRRSLSRQPISFVRLPQWNRYVHTQRRAYRNPAKALQPFWGRCLLRRGYCPKHRR